MLLKLSVFFVFFLCVGWALVLMLGSHHAGVPLWSHAGRRQINAACGVCLLLPTVFAFQRWHTSRFPLCWKAAYAPNWAKGFDGGWEVTWVVKHSAPQVITETHTPLWTWEVLGQGVRDRALGFTVFWSEAQRIANGVLSLVSQRFLDRIKGQIWSIIFIAEVFNGLMVRARIGQLRSGKFIG